MKRIILFLFALCAIGMHAQTLTTAKAKWTVVKNETAKGANTAARVGLAGEDVVNGVRDTMSNFYSKSETRSVISDSCDMVRSGVSSSLANYYTKPQTSALVHDSIVSTKNYVNNNYVSKTGVNTMSANSSDPTLTISNSGAGAAIQANDIITAINAPIVSVEFPSAPNTAGFSTNGLYTKQNSSFVITDTMATMAYARSLKPTYSSLIAATKQYNHATLGNTLDGGTFLTPPSDSYGNYNLLLTFSTGTYQLINGDTILYALQSYAQNLGKYTQTAVSKYATYIRTFDENSGTYSAWKSSVFGYNDVNFSVASGKTGGANTPTWSTFTTNTSAYTFAVNDYIDLGTIEYPHDAAEGDTIELHVHWANNGVDASNRAVKYQLYVTYAVPNSGSHQFSAETSFTVETTIPANTLDKSAFYSSFGVIVDPNIKIGTQIKTRLKRITSTGTAPSNNPFVGQIGIHYKVNSNGSRKMSAK